MSPYAASDLLAGKRFSLQGHGLLPGVDVQRRYLWKTLRGQAEQRSGVGQKVFGFSPEFVFGFAAGWCSESSRNGVRLQPGIVFGLPRNTHCLVKALKNGLAVLEKPRLVPRSLQVVLVCQCRVHRQRRCDQPPAFVTLSNLFINQSQMELVARSRLRGVCRFQLPCRHWV